MNVDRPGRRPAISLLFIEIGLVMCWSSGFIGAILASETSSVFTVLLWRFVLAACILTPFVLPYLRRGQLRSVALQAAIGGLAMFGYLATGVKAIDAGVPAGTAALVGSLHPMLTAGLAGLLIGETVTRWQWLGLVLGLIGVAVSLGGAIGAAPLWGFGLSISSTVCIVFATLLSKRYPASLPLLPSLGVQSFVSLILFAGLAALDGGVRPEANAGFVYAVLWFVLISTLGGYGFYWAYLARASATRATSLIYLTPPVTAIWAWLMFGEPIGAAVIVGFALCLLGVAIARRG